MGEWGSALLFAFGLACFVVGLSSIITGFILPKTDDVLKKQIEYGFFGAAGIVLSLLFVYALA